MINYTNFWRHLLSKKNLIKLSILVSAFTPAYAQQIYTFTPCGATGAAGPTQAQVNSTYLSTNLNGSVTVVGGIQTFTIPQTGGYRIQALGASGGSTTTYPGGMGSSMVGDFTLTVGTVLKILVGQIGINGVPLVNSDVQQFAGTGGGGSYVSTFVNAPLVVAGGGGGSSQAGSGGGLNATGQSAPTSTNGLDGGGAPGSGGTGALGGLTYNWTGWHGGTGAGGFTGNGINNSAGAVAYGTPNGPGTSFINGGAGGIGGSIGRNGGFGGGGSAGFTGGGGGGYSGGGAGTTSGSTVLGGGGGGSFNSGINQNNTAGINSGDGRVVITELCNINLLASGPNPLNPAICSGNSLTLTTNAVSNFTWSNGNTTNTMIVVSPTSNQTYSIIGTSSMACVASTSINVIVNGALPVITVTNTPNSICLGKTATLTAGGALSYTWTGGPGGVQNGQTFTPTATSGYTVTGQNGCGQSTASTTITIAPLALAVASSSNNICAGSTAVLTATAAVNGFTWMPGSLTGTNVTVAPLANTVYTLTASDGTCNGVATLTLTTKTIPVLAVVASATNICEGTSVTMTVSGANTYTWSNPASNNATVSDNPISATSYVVSGTNANNCIASTTQIVVTKPNPVVNVLTNKNLVCVDGAATLTASGGSSSYQWVNGPATNTNVVNPSVNTIYTVTGTGANACTTDKTITINVLSVSVTVSSASTTICEGNSTILNAGGATTYSWVGFGNFASATVSPTLTTTYTVNANATSQGINCPASNTIMITVNALPTVSVSSTKTLVCRTDGSITITATGATSYVWSPTQTNNTLSVRPQSTTTYSVTGTDANGCKDAATIQIVVNPCTGIEEFKGGKTISVYPNPSNGDITVNADSDISLKVINELGQLVQTLTLNANNNHSVSVTGLANGVYFIVGQNSTESVTEKIVVSK